MNTRTAAAQLHYHQRTISLWCADGSIKATKDATGHWRITPAALRDFESQRAEPVICADCGRPYKSKRRFPLCHDCQIKRNNKQPLRNERRRMVTE